MTGIYQVIYPDNQQTMASKGVSDEDLRALLALVDPPGTILRQWDFDHEMNWALTLSGGQKQRWAALSRHILFATMHG